MLALNEGAQPLLKTIAISLSLGAFAGCPQLLKVCSEGCNVCGSDLVFEWERACGDSG